MENHFTQVVQVSFSNILIKLLRKSFETLCFRFEMNVLILHFRFKWFHIFHSCSFQQYSFSWSIIIIFAKKIVKILTLTSNILWNTITYLRLPITSVSVGLTRISWFESRAKSKFEKRVQTKNKMFENNNWCMNTERGMSSFCYDRVSFSRYRSCSTASGAGLGFQTFLSGYTVNSPNIEVEHPVHRATRRKLRL